MITLEFFQKLISEHEEQLKRIDELEKAGFDITDTAIVNYSFKTFEKCLELSFNIEGIELITEWLYDFDNKEEVFFWEDDTEVFAPTVEALWDIVKEYRI